MASGFLYQLLGSKIWPPSDTRPDLTGRTLLITGANIGLGYESVIKFAQCGAQRIIMGVRSLAKGESAKKDILAQIGPSSVQIDVYHLDMLNYETIEAFASRVKQEVTCLDYAVLNAGISPQTYRKSTYGYESGLQVNLLSTTLLALLLLPKLLESYTEEFTPVLELIGSGTHQRIGDLLPGTDDPDQNPLELYNTEESFNKMGFMYQYSLGKLYLMYAQWHLIKLIEARSTGTPRVHVVVVGPGPTQSALGRDADDKSLGFRVAVSVIRLMMKSAEQGARTYVSGLELGERGHGQFWQWDTIHSPAKWCSDTNAIERSDRVWDSVIAALGKDVPNVYNLIE